MSQQPLSLALDTAAAFSALTSNNPAQRARSMRGVLHINLIGGEVATLQEVASSASVAVFEIFAIGGGKGMIFVELGPNQYLATNILPANVLAAQAVFEE